MSSNRYYYTEEEVSPEGRRAVSGLAHAALVGYASAPGVRERPDLVEHAERLVAEARAVGNGKFPEDLFAAAWMHDPGDRLYNAESSKHNPVRAAAAAVAISDFLTHPSLRQERADYIVSMLADMVNTEQASGKHRVDMAEASTNGSSRVSEDIVKMMSEHYQGPIPPEVWRKLQPMLDFYHMRQFTNKTNVETIPIKGLELADNMRHPSSLRESAWFQDYLEAQSFYVPLLEVEAFDGAGAIVRNEAHKLSLGGQGLWQGELKERAEAMSARLDAIGPQKFIEKIFGTDEGSVAIHPAISVNEKTKAYPMHIGEFAIEQRDGTLVAGNYRLKLEGTWAYKKDHDGAEPSDPVGLTIISHDLQSSAQEFVDFLEQRLPRLQLRTPQSSSKPKREAIYIQGSRRYVTAMREEMARRGMDMIPHQIDAESKRQAKQSGYKKYEVAKIYFEIDGGDGIEEKIPAELQFVTKAERKRARTGEVAHVLYKYLSQFEELSSAQVRKIVASAKQELKEVYGRMRHVDANSMGVNERSIEARDGFYEKLEYWLDRAFEEGQL